MVADATDVAIQAEDLRREFGKLVAVESISFAVPRGQVVGFVGANGAGKTTTMRMLCTLDYPTSGSARLGGHDTVQHPERVRRLVGWMPDDLRPYSDMSVFEYMDFFARAYRFHPAERRERIDEVMHFTELEPLADRMVNKLSKGMGQRICLARALIHDPEILILDEPAAGLDPKARAELKSLVRLLADEGKTILISSHILSELSEMCDNLLFIDAGRIIHYGNKDELVRERAKGVAFRVAFNGRAEGFEEWCENTPYISYFKDIKGGAEMILDTAVPEAAEEVLKRMVGAGFPVIEFRREERSLEDAFIDIVSEADAGKKQGGRA